MLEEHFCKVEYFRQSAPIDFVRPATWRLPEKRRFDSFVLRLAKSRMANSLGIALAWLGMTCRISFRCSRAGRSQVI